MKNNIIEQILSSEIFFSFIITVVCTILGSIFDNWIFLFPAFGYIIFILIKSIIVSFKQRSKSSSKYIPKGKKRPVGLSKFIFKPTFIKARSMYTYRFNFTGYSYKNDLLNLYHNKLNGFSLTMLPRIRSYNEIYSNNALTGLFKYFGLSFILPHHWDSYRIGWRYDNYTGLISLSLYKYVKGYLSIKHIVDIERNKEITIGVKANKKYIIAECSNMMYNVVNVRKWIIGYKLGLYMLDEEPSQTDIFINQKKIKK